MPIVISHRGNLNSRDVSLENDPRNIKYLLNLGVFCEVDCWYMNSEFYLGHDTNQYLIRESFLENPRLFVHAKNVSALYKMLQNPKIHCFAHNNDDFVLTSRGFVWQAHYNNLTNRTIVVDLSKNPNYNVQSYGICVDYVL